MIGTIVNVVAVLAGSLAGMFFSRFLTDRIKQILMQALGLSVILIGISMAITTKNILIVIGSMVLGGILGEMLDIEAWLDRVGEGLKRKVRSKSGTFVNGFVTASLLFCVGAMAVVGSFEDGIRDNPSILYAKALLDGVASVAFASTLGVGVMFSALSILLYQGALTFLGIYVEKFLVGAVITELSATGGLLILGIGINLLTNGGDMIAAPKEKGDKSGAEKERVSVALPRVKIKTGNLLPALLFAVIIAAIVERISK